jgi:hypothetical protein
MPHLRNPTAFFALGFYESDLAMEKNESDLVSSIRLPNWEIAIPIARPSAASIGV